MKVIFLDIDGVLNHEKFYKERFEKRYEEGAMSYPLSELDPESISNLNVLCEDTGAVVVLSSTWRHSGIDFCRDALERSGFTGKIIDITPDLRLDDFVRGNEILKWIKDNKDIVGDYYNFTEYVIFDDDTDMLYWQRNNFIHVDRWVGLTMGDVYQAKKILNGGKIIGNVDIL